MRYNGLLGVKYYPPESKAYGHLEIRSIVRRTISMCNMLMLGGLGACLLEKFQKMRCSEIESEAILESKYMHAIFKVLTSCETYSRHKLNGNAGSNYYPDGKKQFFRVL